MYLLNIAVRKKETKKNSVYGNRVMKITVTELNSGECYIALQYANDLTVYLDKNGIMGELPKRIPSVKKAFKIVEDMKQKRWEAKIKRIVLEETLDDN